MQDKPISVATDIRYPVVLINPAKYVTLQLASNITGLSMAAMRAKIKRCDWTLNRQYRKGPDGRIYIDMDGFAKWVEKGHWPKPKKGTAELS